MSDSEFNLPLNEEEIKKIISNPITRRKLAMENHYWFCHIYFSHYIKYETADFQKEIFKITQYETADFQKEIFKITQKENIHFAEIVAFRGSGKSTILSTSYPIWAILGRQEKKHVILAGLTQKQAQNLMVNVRNEFETNELLKQDFGPFVFDNSPWNADTISLPKYGARITAISREQSVRGIRFKNYRPDVVIIDDIEDTDTVRTKESRDKTDEWLNADILSLGDLNTTYILVGNLLHEDSVISRFKEKIQNKIMGGVYCEFPIIDIDGEPTWPGKYPTVEDIENEKHAKGINERTWLRENMLKIISDYSEVIDKKYIHYYDKLPPFDDEHEFRFSAIAVDPAATQGSSSDFTGIISFYVFGWEENLKIYVAHLINKKMEMAQIVKTIEELGKTINKNGKVFVFIENNGFQGWLVQAIKDKTLIIKGVPNFRLDKITRLSFTTEAVVGGTVLLPRLGSDELGHQITNITTAKNDDLADAFIIGVLEILKMDHRQPVMPMIFVI
ncbi:MAG: hypothetical protein V1664_00230 [Candidatus Uhrbacteria bacterium]